MLDLFNGHPFIYSHRGQRSLKLVRVHLGNVQFTAKLPQPYFDPTDLDPCDRPSESKFPFSSIWRCRVRRSYRQPESFPTSFPTFFPKLPWRTMTDSQRLSPRWLNLPYQRVSAPRPYSPDTGFHLSLDGFCQPVRCYNTYPSPVLANSSSPAQDAQ